MSAGLEELTEKEKQVLRLLAAGHSAKSAAAELDLSVYTINDRLRDARKKLGVTSSREAARLLAEYEPPAPQKLAPKEIGISQEASRVDVGQHQQPRAASRNTAVWIAGVALMISIAVAAALVLSGPMSADHPEDAAVATSSAISQEGVDAANSWVGLIDQGQWAESWRRSGKVFRDATTSDDWSANVESVREPLGRVTSRKLISNQQHTDLPNAPKGDYRILTFTTDYANQAGTVETVVLMKESEGWFVVGYFIR